MYLCIVLLGILIIGKAVYIQIAEKGELVARAKEMGVRNVIVEPNRGNIYAANEGRVLASSVPYYEIRMDLATKSLTDQVFYSNVDSLAWHLSRLFRDKSKAQYKNELIEARRQKKRYHLIRRYVDYDELQILKTFPVFRLGPYGGGFITINRSKRFQPHGMLASRTIGYTSKGSSGNIVGIEGAYDDVLKGKQGLRLMQRLPGGVWVPLNEGTQVEPRDGMDVVTTIDVNIQDVAESALLKQMEKHQAHHGCAILMEVKSGAVKAIANLERDIRGRYRERYNYALGGQGLSEPGSTFKLASMIAVLEDGLVQPGDSVDTGNGVMYVYGEDIRDTKPGGHGKITVQRAFEVSSNVGIATIMMQNYPTREKEKQFINKLYSMGLNNTLDLEIRGEGKPEIRYPGDSLWSGLSLPMMSIGYEVKLTPLNILTFYNAVANNGKMVKPKFVREIQYRGKTMKRIQTEILNPSICSMSTIRKVKKMLEGVVESGTADNLKNSNYKIAGKTGTARIAIDKSGYTKEYLASFVGYFPADNPRYTCIVSISSPQSSVYYGNLVAGPVFKEIADKVYATSFEMHNKLDPEDIISADPPFSKGGNLNELESVLTELGIDLKVSGKEKSNWVYTTKRDSFINAHYRNYTKNLVPDVKGMGVKDAVYILENLNMKVVIKGRGTVLQQSLPPGTRVIPGTKIILEMSIT